MFIFNNTVENLLGLFVSYISLQYIFIKKEKIFKSILKNTAFALLMISILCNLTLYTGMLSILLTGVFMLIQVASYNYFAMKSEF